MGDQRAYNNGKNDFYAYTYTTVSERIIINGVSGKMVEKKIPFKTKHQDLPAYGGSSDMYFAKGADGMATQAKLYGPDKKMRLDFDWNHDHKNKYDGQIFHKGTVHVQEYRITQVKDAKTGRWVDKFIRASASARLMTNAEIIKYGAILRHFNPYIKFR